MPSSTSYKSKQFLWLLLKFSIVILLGLFIYNTLVNQEDLDWRGFSTSISQSSLMNPKILGILLVFTSANWILEIIKWQLLASRVRSLSLKEATEQSLSALSFSLLTPNRIGEYGAKAIYFQREPRKKILVLNFIGNFHQLLVTFVLGIAGILIIYNKIEPILRKLPLQFLITVSIFFFVVLTLLICNRKIKKWCKTKWSQLDFISSKLNLKVFLLSFLRYIVFSHQFYFLLFIFGADIFYITAISAITSIYLISSIIPMLSFFDFVLKGSIAVLILGLWKISAVVILSITTLMWILNFVIPAIVGSYFLLRFQPNSIKC